MPSELSPPTGDNPGEPDFTPANNVESQLLDAARTGSTDSFLSTLLLATVLLRRPEWADEALPGQDGFEWDPEVEDDGGRYVVCYTSEQCMSALVRTVPIRFIKLIGAWPDAKWSLSVNPGTAIAATLPGGELLTLANWATDAGLVADDAEPASTRRPEPPKRTGPEVTVMQKVIAPGQVSYYLERGYDRVSGFVHRTREVGHLKTPDQLRSGLGLTWQGSPFTQNADEIYVLRWSAYRPSLYRIPYGGPNEQAMRAMEGWMIERAPFRGNGFAPGDSARVIAEFKVDSARLPHGARLMRIRADGTEEMVAVLDADGPRWLRVSSDEPASTGPAGGA